MFNFSKSEAPAPKVSFAHVGVQGYVDWKQVPKGRKPFSTIGAGVFSSGADLVLPAELWELVRRELEEDSAKCRYARVCMSLGQLLETAFLDRYIKTGNVLMLSEGRKGVDNVFELREGTLRLELDRPTYERCGLVGKPIPHGGRKHTKARFAVEFDLRQSSMVHGKKGFERLVWACKNVLNNSLTWLFHDLNDTDDQSAPIHALAPIYKSLTPTTLPLASTKTPPFSPLQNLDDPTYATEILEWLHMLSLASPRLNAADALDPYLSRYEVPVPYVGADDGSGPGVSVRDLVRVRWEGLVPAGFVMGVYLKVRRVVGEEWAGLSVRAFGDSGYSVLSVGKGDAFVWEWR